MRTVTQSAVQKKFSFNENFDSSYILISLYKSLREFNLNRELHYRYKVSNFGFPEHAREYFWGEKMLPRVHDIHLEHIYWTLRKRAASQLRDLF